MSLVHLHTCCSRALRVPLSTWALPTVGKAVGSSAASAQEPKRLYLSLLVLPNLHRQME